MNTIYRHTLMAAAALLLAACSDFLDTTPGDALSPSTTWKTQEDAMKFLTGCYDGWETGDKILYWDCASDFGYNNFPWEGLRPLGDGTLTAASVGWGLYDYQTIRRCNELLANIDQCAFANEADRENIKAQARFIRAYRYFDMNWHYGGVPLYADFSTAEESRVARASEDEVRKYIDDELDDIIAKNQISEMPSERGRFGKAAVLALRMRSALYYGDWATAKDRAAKIIAMGQYSLDPSYTHIFNVGGVDSPEIIAAVQYIPDTHENYVIGQMYNNADGGWSSIVPTQNLVDTYEMANGLTTDEPGSGYDPTHPFAGRDPRMAMTILYPGCDYTLDGGGTGIFNTLDREIAGASNANYYLAADNASKTALSWAKYLEPITQYADIWNTGCCPVVFRYADVLLSYCEASNEQGGPADPLIYTYLDQIRSRAGMPAVDRSKYDTQDKLRQLIRRERSVELAGEGVRRADIMRWHTADGKMMAETLMNGPLYRVVGTVAMDASVAPGMRATVNVNAPSEDRLIETRVFKPMHRYLPFPLSATENNPQLKQNEGY